MSEAHTLTLEAVTRYHLTVVVAPRCCLPVCIKPGAHTGHTNMFMDERPLYSLELVCQVGTPKAS